MRTRGFRRGSQQHEPSTCYSRTHWRCASVDQCRNTLQQIHHYRGDYQRVIEIASATLAANHRGSTHTHFWLACSLIELGRFGQAATHVQHLFRLADPAHTRTEGLPDLPTRRLVAMGDWARARPIVEHAIESLRGSSGFLPLAHAMADSAQSWRKLGRPKRRCRVQESEKLLERQLTDGTVVSYGRDYVALGKAALQLGRNDDAWRLAHCCLNLSSAQPGPTAHAQQLLGDLASQSNGFDAERAEAAYSKALALAEPRGMRPVIAHCHFGLSKLYRRTGKRRASARALDHCHEHVPRDGHALLSGAGRGRRSKPSCASGIRRRLIDWPSRERRSACSRPVARLAQ